jgi:hypothetical protein
MFWTVSSELMKNEFDVVETYVNPLLEMFAVNVYVPNRPFLTLAFNDINFCGEISL